MSQIRKSINSETRWYKDIWIYVPFSPWVHYLKIVFWFNKRTSWEFQNYIKCWYIVLASYTKMVHKWELGKSVFHANTLIHYKQTAETETVQLCGNISTLWCSMCELPLFVYIMGTYILNQSTFLKHCTAVFLYLLLPNNILHNKFQSSLNS